MVNLSLKTPAERRRLRIRERILTAAEGVFAREGESGLSIRRLAEAINYSPAAIYKYFASKDDLVDELKESFFALLNEEVQKITDTPRPFAERMRACGATYVRIAADKPHHYAAAFSGQAVPTGPDEGEPGFEDSNKGKAFVMLRGMVEEGIANGHLRADLDASLASKAVWASLHGLAAMLAHLPSFPALKAGAATVARGTFIDLHVDLVVRGLENRA